MKNKDKNKNNVISFPSEISKLERQVEAILFSAEEPLDIESIQEKLKSRTDVSKILQSLEKQYQNRGINLICIANKWSFRTSSNLSKFMNLQTYSKKKTIFNNFVLRIQKVKQSPLREKFTEKYQKKF